MRQGLERTPPRTSRKEALRIAAITGLVIGVLAPFVYMYAYVVFEALRQRPYRIPGPNIFHRALYFGLTYSPGAVLFCGGLCYHLARRRLAWRWRLVHGAAVGAIGGVLNYPLTMWVEILYMCLLEGDPPARLSYLLLSRTSDLLQMLVMSPAGIIVVASIFVPSGAILGFGVGAFCQMQLGGLGYDDL